MVPLPGKKEELKIDTPRQLERWGGKKVCSFLSSEDAHFIWLQLPPIFTGCPSNTHWLPSNTHWLPPPIFTSFPSNTRWLPPLTQWLPL